MDNLRVRLTKQMIHKALVELLDEKNIDKISITELCKRATINRTTFYKYYGSQYDVLQEIADEIIAEIEQFSRCNDASGAINKELLEYLQQNKRLCLTLIDRAPFNVFTTKFIELTELQDRTLAAFSDTYTDNQKRYLLKYHRNGCFGLINQWFHDEKPLPQDEFFNMMNNLSKNILFKDLS